MKRDTVRKTRIAGPGRLRCHAYPGTNTPSRGIRAVAGTGEPEEPAALVPPPVPPCREAPRSERKTLHRALSDLTFLLADSHVDKLLTADKPFSPLQFRQPR